MISSSPPAVVIAIEGAPMTGKTYVVNTIKSIAQSYGISVKVFSNPDPKGVCGEAIQQFLQGRSLSGHALYHKAAVTDKLKSDFQSVDECMKANRREVQQKIEELGNAVQLILLDCWSVHAIASSFIRYRDIASLPSKPDYFYSLIQGDLKPFATVLIEQDPQTIAKRLSIAAQQRIATGQTIVPLSLYQSKAFIQHDRQIYMHYSQHVKNIVTLTDPQPMDIWMLTIDILSQQGLALIQSEFALKVLQVHQEEYEDGDASSSSE